MNEYAIFILSAAASVVVNALGRIRRSSGPLRILVVKLDHLGDVVLATPALGALREGYPDAAIDVLVHPGSAIVVENNPGVTRVLTYRSARFARPGGASVDGMSRLREIARAGYDVVVELRGDGRTLLLPFLAGATRRVDRGTVRIRESLRRRTRGAGHPPMHEVETNLEIVRSLLGRERPAERPRVEIHPDSAARASMLRKLEERGIIRDGRIVVLHPGAAWRPRAWRPERFGAVADWILGHYDAQVLLVGSEDERGIEEAVRRSMSRGPVHALTGALTLDELAALLPGAALFVGNDSGPAHLAAACGTPSIVLFGPQDPRRFGPWSERTVVLHHPVACHPCRQTVCVLAEDPCVNRNEIADVIARARDFLGPPRASSAPTAATPASD
jgi:predicted lipopolysaccharide heptosyltransferase III